MVEFFINASASELFDLSSDPRTNPELAAQIDTLIEFINCRDLFMTRRFRNPKSPTRFTEPNRFIHVIESDWDSEEL